jgi:hypothetical protein
MSNVLGSFGAAARRAREIDACKSFVMVVLNGILSRILSIHNSKDWLMVLMNIYSMSHIDLLT